MTRKKTIIIALSTITALCVFIFMGFVGFVKSIKNQRTCEWANIDNIELHAHVDIPKITKSECEYENVTHTKKTLFIINKVDFDMDRYIQTNHLKKLSRAIELSPEKYLNFEKDSLQKAELYHKEESSNGEKSEVLFDKTSGKLWVTIKFKD